jgi:hypothetical protein
VAHAYGNVGQAFSECNHAALPWPAGGRELVADLQQGGQSGDSADHAGEVLALVAVVVAGSVDLLRSVQVDALVVLPGAEGMGRPRIAIGRLRALEADHDRGAALCRLTGHESPQAAVEPPVGA